MWMLRLRFLPCISAMSAAVAYSLALLPVSMAATSPTHAAVSMLTPGALAVALIALSELAVRRARRTVTGARVFDLPAPRTNLSSGTWSSASSHSRWPPDSGRHQANDRRSRSV